MHPDPAMPAAPRGRLAGRATFLAIVLVALGAPAQGRPVVSNVYENLEADRALRNVPVTFSRVGAAGDFTQGITPVIGGKRVAAQVDVLRRAPDGSIRHALVSCVIPRLPAGGTLAVDWRNEAPPAPPPFRWGFDHAALDLHLRLTPESGAPLASDVGRLLAAGWAASERVRVLHDGPIMKEIEIHDIPVDAAGRSDGRLDVYWRLRAFTGQRSVRVAVVVERCKPRRRGHKEPVQCKFKGVELAFGDRTLYSEGAYDHLDQTRYRILAWTDGPIEHIHRRPDYAYWVKGRFVPTYRFTQPNAPADVDAVYARRTLDRNNPQRHQGILEPGILHRHMPGTGGRWEMEPYPAWAVAYLLSGAPKTYRALLHADGNGAGAFYVHVRQDGAPGYDIRTVGQPPLDRGYRMPLYALPDGTKPPVQPDHAHAPSLGYVAYLLTGDRFHAEEMSFWASYQLGEWPHKGLRWHGMDRAFAYGLRHVVDAAFILPDDHPLRPYFTWGVTDCMDQMTQDLVHSGRRVHSPPGGVFRCSGRTDWVNAKRCSAWQYAWVVWSLGNAADKGFAQAEAVRDWAAEYIVGLYTSDDQFRAPDGKVYRYDPRDAMPYSTATQLVKTELVTDADGKARVKAVGHGPMLENYGAVWYYTKVNEDNAYHHPNGLTTRPDANGHWPVRENGWGHGMTFNAVTQKQQRQYSWHRYGAWVGLVSAVEGNVPRAREAWNVMRSLAGPKGIYGYEMIPRIQDASVGVRRRPSPATDTF